MAAPSRQAQDEPRRPQGSVPSTRRGPAAVRLRLLFRRLAWLMLGGAIGLAAELVAVGTLAAFGAEPTSWLLVLVAVPAGAVLSLVPGARELEVTAARTMLGSTAELITPTRTRPAHRLQTMAWVVLHLASGMLVGVCLFAVIPTATLAIIDNATGRPSTGAGFLVAETDGGRVLLIIAAVAVGMLALIAFWPAGSLMARLAGRFLGPTAHDRLDVAISRAHREAEHTRLARELHDGLGHALTIISVQAAAGRRVVSADPGAAAEALETVEATSRDALAELDQLLAVLREDKSSPDVAVGLGDVIAAHRRAGMEVIDEVDLPDRLPGLVHRNVQRIVTEALTNAHRHAAPGPVRVSARRQQDALQIEIASPLGDQRRTRRGGGRGLAGVAERVGLFGGSVDAGPAGDHWILRATLPLSDEPTSTEGSR